MWPYTYFISGSKLATSESNHHRVNNNHQLIEFLYKPGQYYFPDPTRKLSQINYQPGQIYQADSQGILHTMG